MADSLNGNAIYNQYDCLTYTGRQWLTDILFCCLTGFSKDLTEMVEVLMLRYRFAQDVLATSHRSRLEPGR